MSSRKIFSEITGDYAVTVHYDSDWGEFKASLWALYPGGKTTVASYWTDGKCDAIGTAKAMLARAATQHGVTM